MGFYGAMSYQFVYLFEDIKHKKSGPEPDFHLFLFDNLLLFNHLTQDLTLYVTRNGEQEAQADLNTLHEQIKAGIFNMDKEKTKLMDLFKHNVLKVSHVTTKIPGRIFCTLISKC